MYLKSIEMHGFKSFAQTMKLEFHNGITGIVGPNGSGKSNVADAVRWVLGEQSVKSLRGASMQDVIFAGTENRKPLSYAYVAITLDNSDHVLPTEFTEVTIARRLYRSGESEYLLNGQACRLKDVNEMFYDTGIGKEGYSIIGQGQVERILSGKPEERRELFDEAAGIVKFKKRKVAAMKKLQDAEDNLLRLNDILSELERQVGPLERQSEKARIYLKKKEEQKILDVNIFLLDIKRISDELDDTAKKYGIAEAEINEARESYEKIKHEFEETQNKIDALDENIAQLRQQQNDTSIAKSRLESQINLLEEQIRSAEQSGEHYDARMASIAAEQADRAKQLEEYKSQKVDIDTQLGEVAERLKGATEAYKQIQDEIKRCTDGIEAGKNEMLELISNDGNIKSRQERLDTMLEQAQIQKAQMSAKLLSRKAKEQSLKEVVDKCEAELNASIAKLKEYADKAIELSNKDLEWRNKAAECTKTIQEANENYHKQTSRLESLKAIAERYDGYNNSIRRVMEQKDHNKGILGVVSDLIQVEKKYETAIETALGGNIQNIVVEDESTAKQMISFLKSNGLGRATFLPLTSVDGKGKGPDEAAKREQGVIGVADELVSNDAKYNGITAYLLGRVLVVDTVDHATTIARKYHYSMHIVTLEGEYLAPGGSMTGGAFKNKGNLLGRNREIEELEKSIEELKETLSKANARSEEIKIARSLLADDIKENQEALQAEKLNENTARLNTERAREQMKTELAEFDGLTQENADIDKRILDINNGKEDIKQQMANSAKRQQEIKEESDKLAELLDKQTYMEGGAQRNMTEIQMEEAAVRERVNFVAENIARIEGEIKHLEEEKANLTLGQTAAKEDIENRKNNIEEVKKSIIAGDETFAALEKQLAEALAQKESMTTEHKGYFNRQEEIGNNINRLDKEIFRLDQLRQRLEEQNSSKTAYMWEEYELTYHNAEDLRNPELNDLSSMKQELSTVKDEIRRLGDVNVNAIEEYKEVSERYTFLKGQHDDIIESKEALNAIITELDDGMRKQFTEQFAIIQKEFDAAFKQLFGGGKGTLELVEGEDILDCGIRIIAQPPGKKLQNMMQLSGGEKSLSAIALLFGIQNMKPSPFCLLDEIEAALDDSNVDRFAKYLGKLTKNTQFIIITHRRGTMSAADRLYGITMQEKGVSTLVSVNLIESELSN